METKNRRLIVLLFGQQLIKFLFVVWFLIPQHLFAQSPVKMAHSHNDYLNDKPLLSALENSSKILFNEFKKETDRLTFLDGRFSDLGKNISNNIMPLISMSWLDHFQWEGIGEIPKNQRAVLDKIINTVHLENKHIRFWATPDNKNSWRVLEQAGVDLINTDKISEFSNYKTSNEN